MQPRTLSATTTTTTPSSFPESGAQQQKHPGPSPSESDNMPMQSSSSSPNDLSFTILWSPLPPITWIIPFIGHVGIGDSHGTASDFQGPYYVGDNGRMAFGPPTRKIKIDVSQLPGGVTRWDEAISEANDIYRQRMHNICCDNCHSHVACALNRMPIKFPLFGCTWNMVNMCFLIFFTAGFIPLKGSRLLSILYQFGPFLIFLIIYLLITKT